MTLYCPGRKARANMREKCKVRGGGIESRINGRNDHAENGRNNATKWDGRILSGKRDEVKRA